LNKNISIIIPTYNGEKFIKKTIDSCLNQSYKRIKIIIVDDCSTDSTVGILKSYGDKIYLMVNNTNLGIIKSLNKMALGIDSEYLLFLGHDDVLPPMHIEIMLNEFDNDAVAVHCNSVVIDGNGREIGLARDDIIQINKTNNCMFELSINNFISSCGMLHKTDVFQKLKGLNEEYKQYGEWLSYIRELEYGKIKYTTKTKAFYRRHDSNITNTFMDKDVKPLLKKYKYRCRSMAHNINHNSLSENVQYYINEFKVRIMDILYLLDSSSKCNIE
jgi:alpha-1,3-rhamnosyltransferase